MLTTFNNFQINFNQITFRNWHSLRTINTLQLTWKNMAIRNRIILEYDDIIAGLNVVVVR